MSRHKGTDLPIFQVQCVSVSHHVVDFLESPVMSRMVQLASDQQQRHHFPFFLSSIRDVQDWLTSVGHPFISSHALGTGLEQAKTGKTAFLRFLATSGYVEESPQFMYK